jgi:hypothetical protein
MKRGGEEELCVKGTRRKHTAVFGMVLQSRLPLLIHVSYVRNVLKGRLSGVGWVETIVLGRSLAPRHVLVFIREIRFRDGSCRWIGGMLETAPERIFAVACDVESTWFRA